LPTSKQAAPYLEMGVKHFCIGWDVRILHEWWRVNGEGMRGMLDGVQIRVLPREGREHVLRCH